MTKSVCGGVRSSTLDSLGMRYHKKWKHENFHEKCFSWNKTKSHFFRRSKFSGKITFSKKVALKKNHIFLKNVIGFFSRKNIVFMKIFSFSLFMISHPQAVQCWASNSSIYIFGHGLCVRHFFKNPKNPENPPNCTNWQGIFLDSAH